MSTMYYTGNPENRTNDGWKDLPQPTINEFTDPMGYRANRKLIDAVNVALTLGQPLLLTGEPGTGKTQFAYSLAHELGFDEPLKYEIKSTTEGHDLFYHYDTLQRFHMANHSSTTENASEQLNPVNFITYNALGIAILRACDDPVVDSVLNKDFKKSSELKRSIVLIDEIDKAPREVPNDILNEIESMYFKIPELGNVKITANQQYRPIVIITSNSEKSLPDAFLRRCIYYHIPFPERELLEKIITQRLGQHLIGNGKLLSEMISLFEFIRSNGSLLRKKPGTAEILNWAQILVRNKLPHDTSLKNNLELTDSSHHTLFKTQDDQKLAPNLIKEWAQG